jgi:hypothetical protein
MAGTVPEQIVWSALMEPTTITGSTTMVMAFEVAGLPDIHASLEVSIQVTTSPFTGTYEKVEVPVPAFDPLTIHW